jgi:hypothetical protein
LVEKKEIEAYVEKITVEKIYFSIKGDKKVIHSAKQPLDRVSRFISDLSIGEKVILNIEYLVKYFGNVYIDVEPTLSSEDVKILEEFGVRVEDSQLYCGEPIPYENLRKLQGLLPKRASNLRGLYARSHQLNVDIVEIQKVFKALQKEALEIKIMAEVNGDYTQTKVKEMREKIKGVRLSNKSYQIINKILNDAWQKVKKMSSLNRLENELREIPDYQTRNQRKIQLKINQVKREIEELKR